jgi:MFS family permease
MLAGTLVFATLGALATAALGKRFGNKWPFMFCLLLLLAALLLLGIFTGFFIYTVGACLFAAAFGAGLPFAIAEVAELDADGRYVVLTVAAIGMGAMIGPGVAGMLYSGDSAALVLALVAVLMLVAAALMGFAHARKVD